MENPAGEQCPLCLELMQFEAGEGVAWVVCPNGCPTEVEVSLRKPPASERADAAPPPRSHVAGGAA